MKILELNNVIIIIENLMYRFNSILGIVEKRNRKVVYRLDEKIINVVQRNKLKENIEVRKEI